MKKYLFLFLSVLSYNSFAITEAEGIVKRVKTFSNQLGSYSENHKGLIVVYVDELTGACESNARRVAIGSGHPLANTLLSIAMVSKTTKTKVKIGHFDTCNLRSNAWDFVSIELLE